MNQKELVELIEFVLGDPSPPEDGWLCDVYGDYYSPYYKLMYLLASRAKLCVELGVNKGRGLASFARGCDSTHVFGCDPFRLPELDMVLAKCSNAQFCQDSSTEPPMTQMLLSFDERATIDVLHFDTEHNYGQIINEFNFYRDLMSPNAVLLFDDSHAAEDQVKEAVQELPIGWFGEFDDLHPQCGYMVGML